MPIISEQKSYSESGDVDGQDAFQSYLTIKVRNSMILEGLNDGSDEFRSHLTIAESDFKIPNGLHGVLDQCCSYLTIGEEQDSGIPNAVLNLIMLNIREYYYGILDVFEDFVDTFLIMCAFIPS